MTLTPYRAPRVPSCWASAGSAFARAKSKVYHIRTTKHLIRPVRGTQIDQVCRPKTPSTPNQTALPTRIKRNLAALSP